MKITAFMSVDINENMYGPEGGEILEVELITYTLDEVIRISVAVSFIAVVVPFTFVPALTEFIDQVTSKNREITVSVPKVQYKEFRKFARECGFDCNDFLCSCIKDSINYFSSKSEYSEQNN